jgi:hypothetical protein
MSVLAIHNKDNHTKQLMLLTTIEDKHQEESKNGLWKLWHVPCGILSIPVVRQANNNRCAVGNKGNDKILITWCLFSLGGDANLGIYIDISQHVSTTSSLQYSRGLPSFRRWFSLIVRQYHVTLIDRALQYDTNGGYHWKFGHFLTAAGQTTTFLPEYCQFSRSDEGRATFYHPGDSSWESALLRTTLALAGN